MSNTSRLVNQLKEMGTIDPTTVSVGANALSEEQTRQALQINSIILSTTLKNQVVPEPKTTKSKSASVKDTYETFLSKFKKELRKYEEDDSQNDLALSTADYLKFRSDLRENFDISKLRVYLAGINMYEEMANRILLFLAADRGLVYTKSKEDW